LNNKAFAEAVGKNPELLDSWRLLDNLGADEVLRKSKEALEYFTNGRTDKILLDVEELLGGHSKARHGANLSMVEMEQRVLGTHPKIQQSRHALRFETEAIHIDAVNKVFKEHKDEIEVFFSNPNNVYKECSLDYGSKVGSGYSNIGTLNNPISQAVTSDKITISFKRVANNPTGYRLESAFPDVR